MTLKTIEIENIKGIGQKKFELDIIPNRPSLLVAPNGFGKSSFCCAFNSMKDTRIDLKDEDYHKKDTSNHPKIEIEYQRPDSSIVTLTATGGTNTISDELDYFVIKSAVKAKGVASYYSGRATATMEIESVELVRTIPPNESFNNYRVQEFKDKFGAKGGILPNPNLVLNNKLLVSRISENYIALQRASGSTFTGALQVIIDEVNTRTGTHAQIIEWIRTEKLEDLKGISHYNTIFEIIEEYDLGFECEVKSFLLCIQMVWLYHKDVTKFKKACAHSNYKLDKERFDQILTNFNTTWKTIRTSQTGGKLVVNFPKATEISNGQRDILSFLAMLFKARRKLRKDSSILIIDEVFDYLDDANLVAAQYYITKFIQDYKDEGKRIYPLILTHLNPQYFKNFAFNKQKTYYLDKSTIAINANMRRLLMNRNNITIKDSVSAHIFHYHPDPISKRAEFRALSISELWGEGENFKNYTLDELDKYLSGDDYDPFAVCCAVRVKIEEITYNKLDSDDAKAEFVGTKKTRPKLELAEDMGVVSPESYYLLGIIYNDGMHWKEGQDNVSPIASKLENITIKKLISDIFQ